MGLKTIVCTDCGQVVLKEAAYRCERCDNEFCPECMFGQELCLGCADEAWCSYVQLEVKGRKVRC